MDNLCVFCTFSTFAQKIFKGWGWNFIWSFGEVMRSKSMRMVFVASIIMHNLCVFCTFSTFVYKIFKGWGWNFTRTLDKVMHSKWMKMVFVAGIIRHKLCMIYALFDFFCSKIIFDQKLFSYCWDNFDYLGSIVSLSCSICCCEYVYSLFSISCTCPIFLIQILRTILKKYI